MTADNIQKSGFANTDFICPVCATGRGDPTPEELAALNKQARYIVFCEKHRIRDRKPITYNTTVRSMKPWCIHCAAERGDTTGPPKDGSQEYGDCNRHDRAYPPSKPCEACKELADLFGTHPAGQSQEAVVRCDKHTPTNNPPSETPVRNAAKATMCVICHDAQVLYCFEAVTKELGYCSEHEIPCAATMPAPYCVVCKLIKSSTNTADMYCVYHPMPHYEHINTPPTQG